MILIIVSIHLSMSKIPLIDRWVHLDFYLEKIHDSECKNTSKEFWRLRSFPPFLSPASIFIQPHHKHLLWVISVACFPHSSVSLVTSELPRQAEDKRKNKGFISKEMASQYLILRAYSSLLSAPKLLSVPFRRQRVHWSYVYCS